MNIYFNYHKLRLCYFELGVSKKTEKSIKLKKNNRKNRTVKKNRLKLKKNRSVRFGFISLKPEKLNRTQTKKKFGKKPSQNQAKPEKPSQIGFCPKKLNRTWSV